MIEILVAIGILALIFALGLIMSMDMYRGYSRRSERDTLVSILERARSRAMANAYQSQWGVCYDGANYYLFSGPHYMGAITKDAIQGNPGVSIVDTSAIKKLSCDPDGGIVFMQLTGNASNTSMTLTQGAVTSHISINTEGLITW